MVTCIFQSLELIAYVYMSCWCCHLYVSFCWIEHSCIFCVFVFIFVYLGWALCYVTVIKVWKPSMALRVGGV